MAKKTAKLIGGIVKSTKSNYLSGEKGEVKMKERVEKALGTIRPSLQADGGDVELVEVENGIVKVRLTGACGGCPMSQMTLKQGIETYIKREIPEILSVEAV
jgi:Fe-S cluster biogenesis protein NfuA